MRNRSRIKKGRPVSNWHGGVIVKAVLFEAQGDEDRFPAGPRALFTLVSEWKKPIK